MSKSWEYANLVQKVHQYGGPAAYDKALRIAGYNAGYVDGKEAGIQQGLLCMAPFAIGCGYLTYEKLPILWRKIKARIYCTNKQEMIAEEQKSQKKHLNLEPICPNCGKKASGIDEVIKLFGFDKTGDGKVIQRELCKECSGKFK